MRPKWRLDVLFSRVFVEVEAPLGEVERRFAVVGC